MNEMMLSVRNLLIKIAVLLVAIYISCFLVVIKFSPTNLDDIKSNWEFAFYYGAIAGGAVIAMMFIMIQTFKQK